MPIPKLLAGAILCGLTAPPAAAADGPGGEALDDFRAGPRCKPAVKNRFFMKGQRFEIAPSFGYVPNNPFVVRYVGVVALAYHFDEVFSAEAQISYSPDLGEGDLKGLTSKLLASAYNSPGSEVFQQPLDKVGLSALFGMGWAPFYGKINLVGEKVLNFDLYGFAGIGMLSKKNFIATYDPDGAALDPPDAVNLDPAAQANEVQVAPVIGIGQNYFLTQMLALKLDVRSAFYIDEKPQYNPEIPVTEMRLYNNFIASVGVSVFAPKMKPRLYDF